MRWPLTARSTPPVLRAEYGDRYQFQTGSDCEVILALYQEKGPEFLDDLQGMFAFALYDSEKTRT